ncbi:MAG: hypothetical protein HRT37_16690 [Alteromonadaceae bacterium]|nr:hypothetical protein [Alteromonadaceae bacterium]
MPKKTFLLTVNDKHNDGQSHAGDFGSEHAQGNDYLPHVNANSAFKAAIAHKIDNKPLFNPLKLTVEQVINRATAMTCGGCHQPSAFQLTKALSIGQKVEGEGECGDDDDDGSWPDSMGFVHIDERLVGQQPEFTLSPALRCLFLPTRKTDFESVIQKLFFDSSLGERTFITGKRSG